MEKEGILYRKSYPFSVRIVRLARYLKEEKSEYILSRQVLRSGTAICALVSEAKYAQSKADFVHKLQIALKEANETRYWLHLLRDTDYIDERSAESMVKDVEELLRLLTASVNKVQSKR